jgi:hypothetical protein
MYFAAKNARVKALKMWQDDRGRAAGETEREQYRQK